MKLIYIFIFSSLMASDILDKTLAKVNHQIITLSDVNCFFQINKVLSSKNNSILLKDIPFFMTIDELKNSLNSYIMMEVVTQELKNTPTTPKNKTMINSFKKKFKTMEVFNNFSDKTGIKPLLIETILNNKHKMDNYIKTKIKRQNIIVNDDEINETLIKLKLNNNKKNRQLVIKKITNQKYDTQVSSFVKQLLERNQVKFIEKIKF